MRLCEGNFFLLQTAYFYGKRPSFLKVTVKVKRELASFLTGHSVDVDRLHLHAFTDTVLSRISEKQHQLLFRNFYKFITHCRPIKLTYALWEWHIEETEIERKFEHGNVNALLWFNKGNDDNGHYAFGGSLQSVDILISKFPFWFLLVTACHSHGGA